MPDECSGPRLLHHLSAQFCRKPVCLHLPLGRLLDRLIRLWVNALQPPPERLIDRKIELRAGGFGHFLCILECFESVGVQPSCKLQPLIKLSDFFCGLLTAVHFIVNTDLPCTAQFI